MKNVTAKIVFGKNLYGVRKSSRVTLQFRQIVGTPELNYAK